MEHKIGHVYKSTTSLVIVWEVSVSMAAYSVMLLGLNGEAEPPPFCAKYWVATSKVVFG